MGLADLHIHTIYSYDGTASVPSVLTKAKNIGLDEIAVSDHDELKGSLKALELAPNIGIEVIPGIEITTAEGDLLAYGILQKVERGLPLIDTILKVGDLGGFCVVPPPVAGGLGMKSLSSSSILRAIRHPDVAHVLIGIEAYNATAIDRMSNHYAHFLCEYLGMAKLGNSDAHVLNAIGMGMTEFEGQTANDLVSAVRAANTMVRQTKKWNSMHILGSWAVNYVGSAFTRLGHYAQ